jgi:hypothetical protein
MVAGDLGLVVVVAVAVVAVAVVLLYQRKNFQ